MNAAIPAPVLQVRDLGVAYTTAAGIEAAVEGVTFDVPAGRIVALVGESGSGKTTVGKVVGGLLPPNARIADASAAVLGGVDVVAASPTTLRALRGAVVGYVPQDPRRSLHPLKRIGDQITEVLLEHRVCSRGESRDRVGALLEKVGIGGDRARQYPHELSGGMLQRVLIAIAIAGRPSLIVADEPTSALDVTVQKQIMTLLTRIVADDGVSILFITHDLDLVSAYADETVVMRHGRVVDQGRTLELFAAPGADYTRALLRSSPEIEPRAPRTSVGEPPLRVEGVVREVRLRGADWGKGRLFRPVDGVSLSVPRGRTVAVVGESGAGKTSLARLVLGLDRPHEGKVLFDGRDLASLDRAERRAFRRATHLIPQNPASSFDPRYSVASVIAEPLLHAGADRAEVRGRVAELLEQVDLPASFARRSALELSGGQQQRVAIARAISLDPQLIVCDEPTSALDVTVQARIIELLRTLQDRLGVSYLFISHDLAVVSQLADHVVVLRQGRVVEDGAASDVLTAPQSDYTRELLDSVPSRHPGAGMRRLGARA